jgi:hypothetical protein
MLAVILDPDMSAHPSMEARIAYIFSFPRRTFVTRIFGQLQALVPRYDSGLKLSLGCNAYASRSSPFAISAAKFAPTPSNLGFNCRVPYAALLAL